MRCANLATLAGIAHIAVSELSWLADSTGLQWKVRGQDSGSSRLPALPEQLLPQHWPPDSLCQTFGLHPGLFATNTPWSASEASVGRHLAGLHTLWHIYDLSPIAVTKAAFSYWEKMLSFIFSLHFWWQLHKLIQAHHSAMMSDFYDMHIQTHARE